MHLPVPQILQYIEDGRIVFPDDLRKYSHHPKYKEIAARFASLPDPAAMAQYADLKTMVDSDSSNPDLARRIASFVNQYASSEPMKERVAEMKQILVNLTAAVEEDDWNAVDLNSVHALLMHRRRYPATVHEMEIDRKVWALIDKSRASDVRRYMAEFPSGIHRVECDPLLEAQELWTGVSTDPDLVTLRDYIEEEIASPFQDDARALFDSLKVSEVDMMRDNPGKYKADTLKLYLKNDIFSEDELVDAGVVTPNVLKMLNNPPRLEDIEQKPTDNIEVERGATDIFLFGIPSSGKTCVLTGLLGAKEFYYDNSTLGGDYADQLKTYRDFGKAPGRTYGNFVTRITGKIRPLDPEMPVFPINLIEMSGEEFAMDIAYNAAKTNDFESMGTGATRLLTGGNQKVIFIVIDPSASGLIRLATQRPDGTTETRTVKQDIVINKIVNMLAKNPSVLKRTNAIHFIMTKADTIGDSDTREEVAVERIKALYGQAILTLKELAQKYSFNVTTDYKPFLFTFSLGRFYVGDFYEYDSSDADKIMNALKSMVQGEKTRGFFDTIKGKIN